MHDLIMANQDDLSEKALLALGGQAGLEMGEFRKALSAGQFADDVQAEIEAARAVGVEATPTFLINGKRHTGARPIAYFHKQIEAELSKK